MITKELFVELAKTIRDYGEMSQYSQNKIDYRMYEISELSLIISSVKDKWAPEGITFQLFGSNFFIMPDGTITITDDEYDESDEPEIYSLNDDVLLSIIASFLKWRLNVIKKANV